MKVARLFVNGRSQAVRLPKEYRLEGADVYIRKLGNLLVLIPRDDPWVTLAESLDEFSEDFMEERAQPGAQPREAL